MAVPAYSKLPTEEPVSPARIATPESPVYVDSPTTHPILPPTYPTVHRPPPAASICTTHEGDDDDVRTININITIKVPKSFNFPCFRRRCRRDPAYATRDGYQIPREEKKRRFIAVMMVLFYFSFFICGAVAWGLKNGHGIWQYSHVPLVTITFSPFIDFFIVASTILLVRRYNEEKRPGLLFAFLVVINSLLFILHVVILIIAAGPWTHTYGYGWHHDGKMRAIVGLTLYSVSGMTAVKLLLAIWVIKRIAKQDGGLKQRLREFREEIRQCVDGNSASRVEEGDVRRSQEGRVFLS